MIVLALDLARQTGWAAGAPCDDPVYGTFKLDAPSVPSTFLQLGRIVADLIRQHGATQMVLEEPYVGRDSRVSSLMPLFGYRAAAMMAGESKGLLVFTSTPSTVRKHFLGTGGGKRADAKRAVLDKCRWRGWDPRTEDEADALALWDHRCACLSPEHLVMGMRKG